MKATHSTDQRNSGISQAAGPDGRNLPVIDVTHPSFALHLSESELARLTEEYVREAARRNKLPGWLQKLMFRVFLRKSVLARSLRAANGGFLDGMSTYRLKLGAENLDPAWAQPIDRKIAMSLPCLTLRLRLQDMAELLAGNLAPRLESQPGKPLHLVNIAGGPSMDSINALLVLQKQNAGLLHHRPVWIHVLDQDEIGPAFAARAVDALRRHEAPLSGIDVTLIHVPYRWSDPGRLREYLSRLPQNLVAAVSSEGGLFDYGSDEEIVANLEILRDGLPRDTVVAGSVTRADAPGGNSRLGLHFATRPRELAAFEMLVTQAQWSLQQNRVRPFRFSVLLGRSPESVPLEASAS